MAGFFRLAAPVMVVWLAFHVLALAVLALIVGLVLAAKTVLGWAGHLLVFALAVTGVAWALALWARHRPRRLPLAV